VAKRLNRILVEQARAMLLAHDLPKFLLKEATSYSAYSKNPSPTRSLPGKTSFEALCSKKPDPSGIHESGTNCWVRVNVCTLKLKPRSVKRTFVGIKEFTIGWRYFVPESRNVLTSREVIFQPTLDAPVVDVPASGLEWELISQPPPASSTAPSVPVQSKTEPPLLLLLYLALDAISHVSITARPTMVFNEHFDLSLLSQRHHPRPLSD
jgi:hypothetical protein